MKDEELIGKKFGKLTIKSMEKKKNNDMIFRYANCICECGKKTSVRLGNLTSGAIKSCGCIKRAINIINAREMGLKNRKELHCKICGNKHYARGLCKNCYERDRRNRLGLA